jgi:hypothetical protein
MSTASLNISAAQTGTAYTSDLNAALSAINTCHSGSTAPTDEVVSGKFWLDTSGTDPVLKIYRSGWKALFVLKATTVDLSVDLLTAVDVNSTSDERLKDNIKTLKDPVETVQALRGVSYTMDGKPKVGVIAQEVETVVPEVVATNADGYKSVSYGNLVGVLIEAVKEQQTQIDELRKLLEK